MTNTDRRNALKAAYLKAEANYPAGVLSLEEAVEDLDEQLSLPNLPASFQIGLEEMFEATMSTLRKMI